MLNPNLSTFFFQVGPEKIAIEVTGKLVKQPVEISLGFCPGFSGENIPQVIRILDIKRLEVSFVNDAPVKQVTGENQTAKQRIERRRRKLYRLDLAKRLPRNP